MIADSITWLASILCSSVRETTTPFDMVVRNQVSRFHLCMEALRRSGYTQAGPLIEWCQGMLAKHQAYTREHLEDMPEVRDWVWTDTAASGEPPR